MVGLRGESVGTAYVRIIADGSEIPGELEKQLREADDNFGPEGRRASKAYADEFKKGTAKEDPFKALEEQIAKVDLADKFFNGAKWKKFEHDAQRRYGEAGSRAAISFEQEFRKRGNASGISDAIAEGFHQRVAEMRKLTVDEWDRFIKTVEKEKVKVEVEVETDKDGRLKKFLSFAERISTKMNNLSWGKGARNDFINIVGIIMGGLVKVSTAVADFFIKTLGGAISAGIGFLRSFGSESQKMAGQAEEAGAAVALAMGEGTLTTIATGGISLIGVLVVLGVTMEAVALSAGVLAATLSMLAGIVVAIAASLATALGGALLLVIPLVVTLAAAVAGGVLVFQKLKNATGPLKNAMNQVKDSLKGVRDAFTDEAMKGAPKLFRRINSVVKQLKPLATAAGQGFRLMADAIVTALESPAIKRFRDMLAIFLPKAMTTLGSIAGNLLTAIGGIFTAAAPAAQRFLDWLDRITQKFSDWANSGKGQNSIRDFLDRAADSAEALGGFIAGAWDLLTSLITAGQPTGDSLITTLGDKLKEWGDWISTHGPEVTQWFSDAKDFAEKLGKAIETIAAAFDKLDTPQNRKAAGFIVEVLGEMILIAAQVISAVSAAAGAIGGGVSAIIGWVGKLASGVAALAGNIWGPIVNAFTAAMNAIRNTVNSIDASILGAFSKLGGAISGAANAIKNAVVGAFERMRAGVIGVGVRIATGFVGFFRSIMNAAFSAVGKILGAWAKLPGPLGAPARAALPEFQKFQRGANAELDKVEQGIKDVANEANNPMSLHLDASNALATINGVLAATQQLFALWAHPPAPPRSPTQVEHSGSSKSAAPQSVVPQQRSLGGVTINVSTPSRDPVAVANHTVNRLVAVGYAQ